MGWPWKKPVPTIAKYDYSGLAEKGQAARPKERTQKQTFLIRAFRLKHLPFERYQKEQEGPGTMENKHSMLRRLMPTNDWILHRQEFHKTKQIRWDPLLQPKTSRCVDVASAFSIYIHTYNYYNIYVCIVSMPSGMNKSYKSTSPCKIMYIQSASSPFRQTMSPAPNATSAKVCTNWRVTCI